MKNDIPPEDIEAMMRGPHLKGAEGEATHGEKVLQIILAEKLELAPVVEWGHLFDNSRRDGFMGEGYSCDKTNNLLPEWVLEKLPIFLLFNQSLFPADLFIIQENHCFSGAKIDDNSIPLLSLNALVFANNLLGILVSDADGCSNSDAYILTVGADFAYDEICEGLVEEVETEDKADFLDKGRGTFFILMCISSKEWIVDN